MNSALILLAAGSSSRLGQSKQLLKIGSETLLQRAVRIALQTNVSKISIVLGSNADHHISQINHSPIIQIIENKNWKDGMGSSIKVALKKLVNDKSMIDCVTVMVCDQPLITAQNIENLLEKFQETKSCIVASAYNQTVGVPALFDKSLFNELLMMDNDHGAKKIIQKHFNNTTTVSCPEASVDIDTPEDYQAFLLNRP
jgi:molybdenum cofactor cytidylyltransferase